ncbi:hypothetical protein TVAG_018450 [Trichomonas vaginalis G3]|uniref:Uncharacterized protein n=1 Tax=Trichomonas vaginalis (strain ATCC PRA-98 / G3) TaxID=412133 RepID=A2F9Y1_TRIV3|nr:hypothetical protein TVAGG3_0506400 [Trichomonas vaginalis G3]EAX98309.1 hypothetical protein TVAG_018450 [Trichomonas vaginalis G3]KAI5517455.1 hypothetical protein TVAGG3_0506400 [Trichomonas vaginalis G3]|eukprot:XP_001311239.1 hypothetical protein [Trichomonas vaginalis G3]
MTQKSGKDLESLKKLPLANRPSSVKISEKDINVKEFELESDRSTAHKKSSVNRSKGAKTTDHVTIRKRPKTATNDSILDKKQANNSDLAALNQRPTTAQIGSYSTKKELINTDFLTINKRPSTAAEPLKLKKWRQMHFHSGSTTSKREVELLGEWLNSVLAENLESTENPIDVVTNAQHWYSVAFNELVRQVSICCTERGRLFAVIWKRNQDLFSKMIELHKQEREYILNCHKDRVQFLKTDLEFCASRLKTIEEAYNEEKQRSKENAERDVSKFDSLQEKIDVQIKERAALKLELNDIKQKLGIKVYDEKNSSSVVNPFVYELDDMNTQLREIQIKLSDQNKPSFQYIDQTLKSLEHYLDQMSSPKKNYRVYYSKFFITLPKDAEPKIRNEKWLKAAMVFIYSDYLTNLASFGPQKMYSKDLFEFCFDSFLQIFGHRTVAERVLLDFIGTLMNSTYEPSSHFAYLQRFLQLSDHPLRIDAFHFYLYSISMIQKANPGPMFSEFEMNEKQVCAVPIAAATQAGKEVLEKLCSGRILKFYTERITKIATSGSFGFGNRPITDLDGILDYLAAIYGEESQSMDDNIKELWKKIGCEEINNFSDFRQFMSKLDDRMASSDIAKLYNKWLKKSLNQPMKMDDMISFLHENSLIMPLKLTSKDFSAPTNTEDLIPFVALEFADNSAIYENVYMKLLEFGDEVQAKSLKAAKTKFDQSIGGHCSTKIFHVNVRDFYERIRLAQLLY